MTSRSTQDPGQPKRESGVAPDGRRSFGSVSRAIWDALGEVGSKGLRDSEIHRIVQTELDAMVSASSIKNHLAKNCNGDLARFERISRGRYRRRYP